MRVRRRPVPRLLAAGVAGMLVVASLFVAPVAATAALVRPLAARDADAASRGFAPAVTTYNPATGNQGFAVFVQGNAALGATSTVGPVAMGGNLTVGSNFSVATQTAGTFTAPGDSVPTGLLVGGSINWSGSNSGGTVSVGSSAYVKVGNMTGSIVPNNGNNPTHVVPTGSTYGSKPQVALATAQPPTSVNQSSLINFTSAFSTFASQSADMASCANSLVLTNSNGTALSFPLSSGTNAYVTLASGTENVLNISAANLANIATLTFNNSPTSTMPLIINVNTSGVSNNFSWTPGNFNGIQSSGVPYMLWNFSTATQVTIGGSSTVPGTIYAPGATVNDNDQNGLNGGIIAAAYAQGGLSGSPNGGQVQANPFAGTIQSCSTPQLTISLSAGMSTVVPGGTVPYTVTVTNSGQTAYTGATFTDPLTGVLANAVYNANARRDRRHRVLYQPEPDLDREPGRRRHRDHHLLGDGEQPRYRQRHHGQHRHLDDGGQQLRVGQRERRLHRHGDRVRPDDRQDRERVDGRAGRHGGLHGHGDQLRADRLHRGDVHRPADRRPGQRRLQRQRAPRPPAPCPTPART